ncbi:putative cycloheximide resistance protein [Saccharata proteae CBS 121410]|uniref:Cycloheximide resistance protein n=1 Tax=Saccharata proteae CBS 121410 TaxID=1314787 RepID=A0A9P4HQ26_9PEZI|nr:putative cycloheximide resistance protein [Saccharata proteae CBS 121410]
MPFGILECDRLDVVPGTACMNDQADLPGELHDIPTSRLKHGTGKHSHIILVPQPSDSPNDPLNWPLWRKDLILLIISFSASIVGAYGPMLGPGFVTIAAELGISVNTLSQSTSWLILTLGLCVFFANPLAKVYGKRPVYLLASALLFAVSVWGACTKSYGGFLAGRIIGGIGMAPYEVLVQATIGDIYFVHQRATRIAVWNIFLMCGIAGASFVSGYIIEDLGYRWTFGVCAILFGVSGVLIVFLVPETSYIRPADGTTLTTRLTGDTDTEKHTPSERTNNDLTSLPACPSRPSTPFPPPTATDPPQTYLSTLRPFSGRYSHAPLHRIMLRPFVMFALYPSVVWALLIYGTTLSYLVVFSVVNGQIFVSAPYNFSVATTGLTGLSPFILTIIAETVSGPLNDYICLRLTQRNRGVYEPEFRLVLMLVVVVLGALGFFGFGLTVHYQTHWAGPVLTYGAANAAMGFAGVCVFGYLLDSYPKLAEEAFVAVNARNFLTFGLTYFVNDWLARDGALRVFCVLGAAFVGVCALTVPLWVFGKRIRGRIARSQFLNEFMTDL